VVVSRPDVGLDAERSVLGSILSAASYSVDAGHGVIDRVLATGLLPEHFWLRSDATLFALLVEERLAGRPVDPISIAGALEFAHGDALARGRLEVLAREVTAFGTTEHHARIVLRAMHSRESS
jgi:hypothetical protein